MNGRANAGYCNTFQWTQYVLMSKVQLKAFQIHLCFARRGHDEIHRVRRAINHQGWATFHVQVLNRIIAFLKYQTSSLPQIHEFQVGIGNVVEEKAPFILLKQNPTARPIRCDGVLDDNREPIISENIESKNAKCKMQYSKSELQTANSRHNIQDTRRKRK